MKNQVNSNASEFFYPVRDTNDPTRVQLVPISEELYRELYPDIWKTQKRMQRSGQCVCPRNMLWRCDGDCVDCPYRACGNEVYLSTPIKETGGLDLSEILADNQSGPESLAMDRALLDALYRELSALDHEGRHICQLMMEHSEREAAELMGLSRSSFKRRWAKLRVQLQEKLRDYYF